MPNETAPPAAEPCGAHRPWALAALFAGAGVLHLARPSLFTAIVPPWFPAPRLLVLASGAAALLGAAGVLPSRTRRAAGWALLAYLVAVFPANVQMLLSAQAAGQPPAARVLLWLRLPVQLLLLAWVWRAAVRAPARGRPEAAPA